MAGRHLLLSLSPFGPALRGLIVSCQAPDGHPLRSTPAMLAMALCAEQGGASAIRANGARDVRAIAAAVGIPVIGIRKRQVEGLSRPAITPSYADAASVARAGAHVVAVEATRQTGTLARFGRLATQVHDRLRLAVMADVSTFEEGMAAWQAGADLVATTLSGYTPDSPSQPGPDLDLVRRLAAAGVTTVAEGRFRSPAEVAEAIRLGASAVVVGTAITDPRSITAWFAEGGSRP